jgi:hypothetical protein
MRTAVATDPAVCKGGVGISKCHKEAGRTKPHDVARRFQAVRRSGGRAEDDLSIAGEVTGHDLRQIAL